MQLNDFVRLLKGVRGPSAGGEYTAQCPAHDDSTASLCVGQGKKGIVIKCQAGCESRDIVAAMGLSMRDLFEQDQQTRPAAPPAEPAAPAAAPAQKPKSSLGKIDRIYPYQDEAGKTLFEVVRYVPKDFRQRVPDPGAKSGYRWSIKGVRKLIYRLPQVVAAIAAGQTVYVVEGEKDADRLATLGLCATTAPMGADKWLPDHSQLLQDALVCILPDHDEPGHKHGLKVAEGLHGIAREIRLLDLSQALPTLPDKGDVSDLLALMGDAEGLAALDALEAATAPWQPPPRSDYELAKEAIEKVPGYCVEGGKMSEITRDGTRALCTFVAAIGQVVLRNDGQTDEKLYQIQGWDRHGRPLKTVQVPLTKFAQMNWPLENWDTAGNIMPGNMVAQKLRNIINQAGENAERLTIYTHTGWRKLDEWIYLYPGGAVGAEDITVQLDSGLNRYTLDSKVDAMDGIRASWGLIATMTKRCYVPLMAMCYLAPLRDALVRAGYAPSFSMFLLGSTGTRKSTLAALMLSHFGQFDNRNLPASFNNTSNYTRRQAFSVKDMLLVVDDYHPETSVQERRKMAKMAQDLSRAFGDGSDRGRMKSDLTLAESMPPRCISLITGEDLPEIGESGVARYFILTLDRDSVPLNGGLTMSQKQARQGYLRAAMRGYIDWLRPQMDALPERLAEDFERYRSLALEASDGQHARAPEAVAHLMIGYEQMLRYMAHMRVLGEAEIETWKQEAWQVLMEGSQEQARQMSEEKPTQQFLDAISELLVSRKAAVMDLTDKDAKEPLCPKLGWADQQFYYFLYMTTYTEVCQVFSKQGIAFSVSKAALLKQLKEAELCLPGKKAATRVKNINGVNHRVLWFPRHLVEGPPTLAEQVQMQGFTPVEDDPDNPF